MTVHFNTSPPPSHSGIRILRCRPGNSYIIRIHETLRWLKIHWIDGRTWSCNGPHCHNCGKGFLTSKGYASGCVWIDGRKTWDRVIIEVPMEVDYSALVPGVPIKMWRDHVGKAKRLYFDTAEAIFGTQAKRYSLSPFPIEEALSRLLCCEKSL